MNRSVGWAATWELLSMTVDVQGELAKTTQIDQRADA